MLSVLRVECKGQRTHTHRRGNQNNNCNGSFHQARAYWTNGCNHTNRLESVRTHSEYREAPLPLRCSWEFVVLRRCCALTDALTSSPCPRHAIPLARRWQALLVFLSAAFRFRNQITNFIYNGAATSASRAEPHGLRRSGAERRGAARELLMENSASQSFHYRFTSGCLSSKYEMLRLRAHLRGVRGARAVAHSLPAHSSSTLTDAQVYRCLSF